MLPNGDIVCFFTSPDGKFFAFFFLKINELIMDASPLSTSPDGKFWVIFFLKINELMWSDYLYISYGVKFLIFFKKIIY